MSLIEVHTEPPHFDVLAALAVLAEGATDCASLNHWGAVLLLEARAS